MKDIQSYIEGLKIKKDFLGGFDKEAVYTSMKELSSMYQEDMVQLKAENERLETEYKTTASELEQANKDIQLLKIQLEEGQKSQRKYDLRFNALTQAIDAINASRDEVIEESQRTAEGIIAEANEKFERISQECRFQKQQKELALAKMTEIKQQFSVSMENLHSILAKMLSEVDGLKENGLERMPGGNIMGAEAENDGFRIALSDEADRLVRMMTGSVSEHDG